MWSAYHGYDALLRDFALPRPAAMIAGELSRGWAFISGDFALGFALAALLFSFWDPVARHASKFFGRDVPRSKKVSMARRWVALSEELFADAPDLPATPTPLGGLPKEVYDELLQRNEEAKFRRWSEEMNRLRRRYQTRIAQARDEIELMGISIKSDFFDARGSINLVNTFIVREWATALGLAGRKLLDELGEGY